MGEINCKDCITKDSKLINELCLGTGVHNLEDEGKTYIDKAGNKTKNKPKFKSKNEDNDSLSIGDNNALPIEDKELLTRISYNFEKINDGFVDSSDSQRIYNDSNAVLNSSQEKNNNLECPSYEGRYIDPYGPNYQDYDLSHLEYRQDSSQFDPNYATYISYKEYKTPSEVDTNSLQKSEVNKSPVIKK